ncbi:thiosulfate oxidation carrier complex protein SoxZ [Roseospira marina]|uniref:Thiosulfate oxidation carrier complex protein SoxZ n=1 Tax=Roseospira marina TaxID=140057 RepID=A0A5M6IG52_9PROT|nr:thiosulfate oxidation carrier complex protein SoxZ [Roseospira marina]KAA5606655.1 thiosulfate oxidation carrier complex protein SoxZ [Roseospira marina]MBB4313937.1 sulfur-oxidizing protein SoxZ [Roseospira marina]MBB5087099.1 sulfur-oxidizing protein SoxZ [Roseospira marina]
MATIRPRVKAPKKAAAGEIIEIKTLINHDMESGQRKDKDGNPIPRQIIHKFTAEFNGTEFFSVDLAPAISANPYLSFNAKVDESGEFTFRWFDDDGSVYEDTKSIEVT